MLGAQVILYSGSSLMRHCSPMTTEMACRLYTLKCRCLKKPDISLFSGIARGMANFFLVINEPNTLWYSSKTILVPICITQLVTILVNNECKISSNFTNFHLLKPTHAQQGEVLRVKKNAEYIKRLLPFVGTLLNKIEALDPYLNKIE